MKMLITGSSGVIGRNLAEYFQKRYEQVACPKRAELDLVDTQAVHDYLTAHQFDVVIHAAITTASVEQNLKMYFGLEGCSGSFGRMLSIGSGAEYDLRHYVPKMKEEYFGTHIPADIYGFSKYVIARDIERPPRNIFNLRVFGIYGKHENYKRRFISNNICRVLSGLDIAVNRNVVFDYLYTTDFLTITELFLRAKPKYRSYNICTGRSVDLLTLAGLVQKIDGRNRAITVKQDGMNPEYTGDNTRFLAEFGDYPFLDHETAVRELYRWYQDPMNFTPNPAEFT
jgi:GDP-L-fucose synthase